MTKLVSIVRRRAGTHVQMTLLPPPPVVTVLQAPVNTPVTEDVFSILTAKHRIPVPMLPGKKLLVRPHNPEPRRIVVVRYLWNSFAPGRAVLFSKERGSGLWCGC